MTDSNPNLSAWLTLTQENGTGSLSRASELQEASKSALQVTETLRKEGFTPALAAAAQTQLGLRSQAQAKFGPLAARLLFTRAGLEQASRFVVAELHAARFRTAGLSRVADLGCGIGAESLALLRAGITPIPVEIDHLTARFAAHNLAIQAALLGVQAPTVHEGDATDFDYATTGADGAFFDPARRTAGHSNTSRLWDPAQFSPSLDFVFHTLQNLPGGVKLGPGYPHDQLPPNSEAQWITCGTETVELALWFGPLAKHHGRTATVLTQQGEKYELHSPTPLAQTSAADTTPALLEIGKYIYDPAGCVIRARLLRELSKQLNAGSISPEIAYLTSDSYTPTPFAQVFRVDAVLPASEKALRKELAARSIGTLEIKKRGANVDPATLRKRLKLCGQESATLLLTRDASNRHIAILATRP